MKEQFKFQLTSEEYLDYLRAISSHSKQFRGRKLLLTTSIPTVILCSILYFKWYQSMYHLTLGILFIFCWSLFAVPKIWSFIIKRRINNELLKEMKIRCFDEVNISFHEQEIISEQLGVISYNQVTLVLPLQQLLVIGSSNQQVLLLPYRVFQNEAHLKHFLNELKDKVKH